MRILYGVQGTGNGHITRARMMAEAFSQYPVSVDYLFSGKDDRYFNMEPFGDYHTYPGLSFVAKQGRIDYLQTIRRNNLWQFYRDVNNLDLRDYDLVITDFEPITAWAARKQQKPCVGISHQAAFRYPIPIQGSTPVARLVMNWFAPADHYLGLHWHHFDHSILPPMIKTDLSTADPNASKFLVYLPFLPQQHYYPLFQQFPDCHFVQYHDVEQSSKHGNINCHPLSRSGFLEDFSDCAGVISNAGFGACSEAIHYGKKLLVVPLQGQMEQLSNAAALTQLGLGDVSSQLSHDQMNIWLDRAMPRGLQFPDVAAEIVQWLAAGMPQSVEELTTGVWNKVSVASC